METSGPMRRQLLPALGQLLMGGSAAEHDPHPLFDTGWYLTRNPYARAISVNPIVHYLRLGASQGWDPNPYFDTKWYLAQNKDVGRAGTNPLVHYLKHGAAEGRDPSPSFDTKWYLLKYQDVARSGLNPLAHFLRYGKAEGRAPAPGALHVTSTLNIELSSYAGSVEQRSTRHVAGWMIDSAGLQEHPEFEVVIADPKTEIIVARGRADRDARGIHNAPADGNAHGFYLVLPNCLTEAERDRLIVRPVGGGLPMQNAATQQTRYEPIQRLAMDIVDNCNLRCPFCVYDYSNTYRTNLMSEEVFDAAIRLIPYVGHEYFWLSCLHEPTMHPRFADFIERIPKVHRSNVFFTSNLTRRMPQQYYDTLGRSGLHHINISIESRDPVIYERMRKGSRHRIFLESWDQLIAAFKSGSAPPGIRYIIMAYKANLAEIPDLVAYLREERSASAVEIRHTFDMPHIAEEFKQAEYLDYYDWQWLKSELAKYPANEVVLSLPPLDEMPMKRELSFAASPDGSERTQMPEVSASTTPIVPGAFEFRLSYNGKACILTIKKDNWPAAVLAETNVVDIHDPVDFFRSLELRQNSRSAVT
jgi:molybdenum cofactor biosynthesis enzyme MoaA